MQEGGIRGSRGGCRCPGWFGNYWAIKTPGYGDCLEVMLTSWEEVKMGRSCMGYGGMDCMMMGMNEAMLSLLLGRRRQGSGTFKSH
jgi:hypothetical protein